MVFLLMFGMMVVYCMRINVGVIMIIILDEEVYMKVGILEVKWNVRFWLILENVFVSLGYLEIFVCFILVWFLEKFILKFNLNCKKKICK